MTQYELIKWNNLNHRKEAQVRTCCHTPFISWMVCHGKDSFSQKLLTLGSKLQFVIYCPFFNKERRFRHHDVHVFVPTKLMSFLWNLVWTLNRLYHTFVLLIFYHKWYQHNGHSKARVILATLNVGFWNSVW